jgi:hypothetical protein
VRKYSLALQFLLPCLSHSELAGEWGRGWRTLPDRWCNMIIIYTLVEVPLLSWGAMMILFA